MEAHVSEFSAGGDGKEPGRAVSERGGSLLERRSSLSARSEAGTPACARRNEGSGFIFRYEGRAAGDFPESGGGKRFLVRTGSAGYQMVFCQCAGCGRMASGQNSGKGKCSVYWKMLSGALSSDRSRNAEKIFSDSGRCTASFRRFIRRGCKSGKKGSFPQLQKTGTPDSDGFAVRGFRTFGGNAWEAGGVEAVRRTAAPGRVSCRAVCKSAGGF